MSTIQPPRGTHDILPPETHAWQWLESTLAGVIQSFGYREIRVPVFEHTELFKRGVGDSTDIVNKEMYTFEDRSQRCLTLRPECTAGVVRAYLSHGLNRQPSPVKLWYAGPMFRYERTQTGRQRQFHQVGIEAFGSAGPAIDAETILAACRCLEAAGIATLDAAGRATWELKINSIGCRVCRPSFRDALRSALAAKLDKLCQDCRDRYERNPLRMLDCKRESCQALYVDLPSNLDNLCEQCLDHWSELKRLLDRLGVKAVVNDRLVRGLDYYSRTVFEVVSSDSRLGAQSTILAGGRYDYLVETLGGPSVPAVGWALGMERWLLLLDSPRPPGPLCFVVSHSIDAALKLSMTIRSAGFSCEMDFPPTGNECRSFSKQLERADKLGATWAVIWGRDEQASNEVLLKNMSTRQHDRIPIDKLIETVERLARSKT